MFLFHQDRVSSANGLKHFNKTFKDSYVFLYDLIRRFLGDIHGRLVLILDNVRNAMCQNVPCCLNEILKFCYYQKYTVLIGFSGGDRCRCVPKMENNFNDCYIDIPFTSSQASVFLQRQLLPYTSREYATLLKIVDDFSDLTGLYPCELTHLVTAFHALYSSVGGRLNWADLAIQARIKKDYEMWSHRVLKSNFKSLTTRKPQVLRLQIKLAKASRSGRSYPIPNPTYVYRVFYCLEKTAEAENGTILYNVNFIHNSVLSYHRGQNCHISPGIMHSFTSLSLNDDDDISTTE
ncbi:hypothetical protein IWQ61_004659 [Dispira simplex]|nr:hypothetical protein IWQ61_004659 [Dispira simplex]